MKPARKFLTDHAHLLIIAAVSGLLHLVPIFLFPEYGYFRDEFYYIACAKRLAWGYVDHPPLAIHSCTYCRENSLPIYVCRHAKVSMKDLWTGMAVVGSWRRSI